MAVRVGDDHVAALINKVHGGAVAALILADVVLPDHLVVVVPVDAKGLAGGADALHVSKVVADALVMQQN